MTAVLVAVGILLIGATASLTFRRYGELPDRIPMHFWFDGTVTNYGPRPVAWLLVGIQIVIAVSYALTSASAASHLVASILAVCVIAICWRSQVLIISAALSGEKRVAMTGFYLFLAATMTVGFAAVRFTPP
jgi:uncharacterized membrane protein